MQFCISKVYKFIKVGLATYDYDKLYVFNSFYLKFTLIHLKTLSLHSKSREIVLL